MKVFEIILLLIIIMGGYACQKEKTIPPIYAGVHDSTFIFNEFSTPLDIQVGALLIILVSGKIP